jgi:voltage-gated potassium channel
MRTESVTSRADAEIRRARWRLLVNVVRAIEPLMALLGIVWLLLVVLELTAGLSPTAVAISRAIWAVFILDFIGEFLVAPDKSLYLRRHWIVAVSLALPALRFVRAVRLLRLARVVRAGTSAPPLRLLRTVTSLNRALGSLRATMRRRGAGYVVAMTLVVTVGGAAGMYALENGVADPAGIHDFGSALWWTAMIMTTMGSAYWPETAEGRVLCILLALYAFAVFGYVTAMLATFFVNRDAERPDAPLAGEPALDALRQELAALRRAVVTLSAADAPRVRSRADSESWTANDAE